MFSLNRRINAHTYVNGMSNTAFALLLDFSPRIAPESSRHEALAARPCARTRVPAARWGAKPVMLGAHSYDGGVCQARRAGLQAPRGSLTAMRLPAGRERGQAVRQGCPA